MNETTAKPSRIMEILAHETGGKSYKSHKYSLDVSERSSVEYGEAEKTILWKRRGETRDHRKPVSLSDLSRQVSDNGEQLLTYFLDGSRHVYKVDDMGFEKSGNRTAIYPIIAGQIGVGCCKRVDKQMRKEKFEREIVVAMPDIAQSSRKKQGFLTATAQKLNSGTELARIIDSGWKFSTILSYKSAKEEKEYNDKGTAQIQTRMMENEQKMVVELVREKKLNNYNYLVKDGSLEYRPNKALRGDPREYQRFKNNYDCVIGVSKKFNPEVCLVLGDKPNPGFIADLKLFERTPVAYFEDKDFLGDIAFAVWYIRIRDQSRTRTPFDGVIKVEKILVSQEEVDYGIDSDLVDQLSANLINERNPVCYGSDMRWANHLYPVYLTERYVKSHYLSAESFLHLF
jgi:predicted transposase YbfD/YdcC